MGSKSFASGLNGLQGQRQIQNFHPEISTVNHQEATDTRAVLFRDGMDLQVTLAWFGNPLKPATLRRAEGFVSKVVSTTASHSLR